MLSVRFEVGVSLLLAPARADKWKMQEYMYSWRFKREHPPELLWETGLPGLTESTECCLENTHFFSQNKLYVLSEHIL